VHQVTNDIEELLAELRQAGETPDQALLDRIEEQGSAVVQPLVAMALEAETAVVDAESPEAWAPLHAVRLLGTLTPPEAVEPLLPLLASDWDWLVEDLMKTLGRVGEPAVEPLRSMLFDRSHGMWTRAHAGDALGEIGQVHPELRGEVVATLRRRLVPEETWPVDLHVDFPMPLPRVSHAPDASLRA
jgi:hypothetical protein